MIMNDELWPEYDLRQLLKGGVRGKYATQYRAGTNLVRLAHKPKILDQVCEAIHTRRVPARS
jgi:hypothetical protein